MALWDWIKQLFGGQVSGRRHIPGQPGICPYCRVPLRANDAQQCFACGADWHDVNNVLFRGAPNRQEAVRRQEAPVVAQVVDPRPARSASPASLPAVSLASYNAGQFTALSDDEIRRRAKGAGNLFRNAWFGRRDLIPPATDPRTQLIDAGMVGHGYITPEELAEIHQVGAQMDELRPDLMHAWAQANQQVALDQAERQKLKEQKKAESAEKERQRLAAVAHRKATDIVFLGRGVSRGLADRRSNVEQLQRLGLPVLSTPAEVAAALGLTIPRLRWLAFHSDAATRVHYVSFTVPKKSGGTRELAAPHRSLALCQQWILTNILAKVPAHDAAQGFLPGKSTLTNAKAHVGRQVVVNADLADFFPTITFHRVRGVFQQLGYSPAVATILALLATESPRRELSYGGQKYFVATGPRRLPQGACTSPALSNLVSRRMDSRLSGIGAKLGFAYTRYADDLTFSADGEAASKVGYLLARLRHIAQDEGFAVNEAKTRVQRRNTAQVVTGLVVNDKPCVPRQTVRRLRAILHRAQKEGLAAQNRKGHPHFEAWVRGMIAYVGMANHDQGRKLELAYATLAHR